MAALPRPGRTGKNGSELAQSQGTRRPCLLLRVRDEQDETHFHRGRPGEGEVSMLASIAIRPKFIRARATRMEISFLRTFRNGRTPLNARAPSLDAATAGCHMDRFRDRLPDAGHLSRRNLGLPLHFPAQLRRLEERQHPILRCPERWRPRLARCVDCVSNRLSGPVVRGSTITCSSMHWIGQLAPAPRHDPFDEFVDA